MINLAVNMLTYNSENLVESTLQSVLPYVSEAHIIDTGSKDKTVEVLYKVQKEFPFLTIEVRDVDNLGEAWKDKAKNVVLTGLLNNLKNITKSDWILKIDDDEVYPEAIMNEIVNLEPKGDLYTLYFRHFQKDTGLIIHYRKHKNLRVTRLFRNLPEINWRGEYGRECISINGKRFPTRRLSYISNPFLHFGEYRKGVWEHSYRFHTPGHCGLPVPEEFKKYVPN
jgi:glycosyltransferase involved in cell wall biosynthesis